MSEEAPSDTDESTDAENQGHRYLLFGGSVVGAVIIAARFALQRTAKRRAAKAESA